MARLIPKIDPGDIENPGERKLAAALVSQLPKSVDVFHSFNWLARDGNKPVQEGECDFVLLDPRYGLLFIEVKGGSLSYDPRDFTWRRILPSGERREINKNPFAQARTSMHEICDHIRKRIPGANRHLPFTHGYATAFPDARFSGALPADVEPAQILDAEKCQDLGPSIERIFRLFARHEHRSLDERQVQAVHEALYPRFDILPVLWRKVEDQEERLQRLTEEQQRLLDLLRNQKTAVVAGVAGSGKTILALAKAQQMAARGLRTLFLCYNKPLKEWLQSSIEAGPYSCLVIENFHGLAEHLCKKVGISIWDSGNPREASFWQDIAPECLMNACDLLSPEDKFDAVIVDEGQDFHELWWTALDGIFRHPEAKECFYVFHDPNQNLYVDKPSIPADLGAPFLLTTNCRNTVRISEHCASLINQTAEAHPRAPEGEPPRQITARSLEEAFRLAGRQVREWCMPSLGNLRPSQIAVLADSRSRSTWPRDFQTINIAKSLDSWRANKGVLLDTWSRFKGLEADAIVIIETPTTPQAHAAAHLYVAHSRAKHLLTIIRVEEHPEL